VYSEAAEARFDSEDRAAITALDSARAALPSGGSAADRYLSSKLGGLVTTLLDRHSSELEIIRGQREAMRGVPGDAFSALMTHTSAGLVAEETIFELAAWERRYLHETYLADSYIGDMLADAAALRANGASDTTLLHRPELEARIASFDSAMVAEIRRMK
jgi:hypothetical protein